MINYILSISIYIFLFLYTYSSCIIRTSLPLVNSYIGYTQCFSYTVLYSCLLFQKDHNRLILSLTFISWADMWSQTHHMSLSWCPQTWSSASCSSTTTQASPGQACPTLPIPPIPLAKRAPLSTPSHPPAGWTAAVRPGRPAINKSMYTYMSCRVLACMFSVLYQTCFL